MQRPQREHIIRAAAGMTELGWANLSNINIDVAL
jgi:hypothetical protein